jgi:predicted kinase
MLIIFSGLPGTGKTTLARELADQLQATYLRIDTIEEEMLAQDGASLVNRGAGYCVAYAVAADNLKLGRTVVADSVNPIRITRHAWHEVARSSGVPYIDVAVSCPDRQEHRGRIDARPSGTRGSDWMAIQTREYEPPDEATIVIDTSGRTVQQCLADLREALRDHTPPVK